MAQPYNYFRDYDPGIGRYIESDLIGLRGGLNSYSYVGSAPLNALDSSGLTREDMRRVWFQMLGQFTDLSPSGWPFCGPVGKNDAYTSASTGNMVVKQKNCDKPCLTKNEYHDLLHDLLHESMHSSDPWWRRDLEVTLEGIGFYTRHHQSIARRANFEMSRVHPGSTPGGAVWGTPRPTPINEDAMYKQYRDGTPACQCDRMNGVN